MAVSRENIIPNPPRWKPNPTPASIQVPGLDTSAPVHDQIEQIEQLITIKLQNIDENFSKIHNVLANKLLPAVKRYAVGTEPVRDAAKFWTSFYEQAAQIRIPTSDDHSTVNEFPSQNEISSAGSERTTQDDTVTDEEAGTPQESLDSIIDHTETPNKSQATESSFHPNQDAFSSTPAAARIARTQDNTLQSVEAPSWSASLESPFARLSNEVKNFTLTDEEPSFAPSSASNSTIHTDEPTPAGKLDQRPTRKGKNTPLRENLLRHQLYSAGDMSSIATTSKNISPLKPRGNKVKTPIAKDLNPYIPAGTDSRKWDGVVDLRDPSTATPHRSRRAHPPSSRKVAATPKHSSDDEDDFDALPPGMSPPVMMSPVRLQKTADQSILAPTPLKGASARIKQDILRSLQKGRQPFGATHNTSESSLSTMPTPPSFSQYRDGGPPDLTDSLTDPSFDSIMRRVGLDVPTPSAPGPSKIGGIVDDSAGPAYDDLDSEDSLDDFNPVAHPSAAFMMQGRAGDDDSFGSSNQSTDSLNDEEAHLEGAAPVHPFAGGIEDTGDDDSDSFDDDYQQGDGAPTETLFGVAPGQRAAGQPRGHELRMLGQDMLDDMTATGAYVGGVEESPTPAGWGDNRS